MRDGRLAGIAELESLSVVVERVSYTWQFVDVGWARPHGELVLEGAGCEGRGELVAFDGPSHDAFAAALGPVGTLSPGHAPGIDSYARCAWEAALIDLGLRQHGRSWGEVFGVNQAQVRFCTSHGTLPTTGDGPFKLDHEPGRDYANVAVVVLDFKGLGSDAVHVGDDVILEDPNGPVRAPWSLDQSLSNEADLPDSGPTHVNLKAARMGGFLPALRLGALALERGLIPYWGGQWELGVGRTQAQAAAAVICADAWNDIAPTTRSYPAGGEHWLDVDLRPVGFGR